MPSEFELREVADDAPAPSGARLVRDPVGEQAADVHLAEPLDEILRVGRPRHLDEVRQGLHSLALAEVVAPVTAVTEDVVLLEPEAEQVLRDVARACVAGRSPRIHRLAEAVHQERLARPPAVGDLVPARAAL